MVEEGDVAPGFSLENSAGGTLSLKDMLDRQRNLLLVFLRHLG